MRQRMSLSRKLCTLIFTKQFNIREYRKFPDLLDILQLNTANLLKFIHNTLNIQCPAYVTVRYIHVHIILMNKLLQMK